MIEVYHIPCPRDPPFTEPACMHEWAVYVKVISNGQKRYKWHCMHCGKSEGNGILKKDLTPEIEATAIPYNGRLDRWDERLEEAKEKWREEKNRVWKAWYNDYLRSSVWERKRELVLKRCRRLCESCMSATATQAHHTSYALVGREPLFHLRGVCDECHEFIKENGNGTRWER